MFKITNIWIRTNKDSSPNDFWYLDYENGIAKHSTEKPKNESIRKWKGTVIDFLQQREIKILEQTDEIIKFRQENNS